MGGRGYTFHWQPYWRDTHITRDMCTGIHISRGYTYHCDTGAYFRNFTVSSSFREERVGGYTFRSSSLDLYVSRLLCAFSTLISGKWSLFAISLCCFSLASRLVSWPVCLLFSPKSFSSFFWCFLRYFNMAANMRYSQLPITRTFKGNRKKVRVIGSSSYREFELSRVRRK